MLSVYEQLIERVEHHLNVIYQDVDLDTNYSELSKQLLNTMCISNPDLLVDPKRHHNNWDQTDVMLITYGDSIEKAGEKPLHTLHDFLTQYCSDAINTVHLLPFFHIVLMMGFRSLIIRVSMKRLVTGMTYKPLPKTIA
jgi:sucrose phosphorylase